jgi:hypothetical protein
MLQQGIVGHICHQLASLSEANATKKTGDFGPYLPSISIRIKCYKRNPADFGHICHQLASEFPFFFGKMSFY